MSPSKGKDTIWHSWTVLVQISLSVDSVLSETPEVDRNFQQACVTNSWLMFILEAKLHLITIVPIYCVLYICARTSIKSCMLSYHATVDNISSWATNYMCLAPLAESQSSRAYVMANFPSCVLPCRRHLAEHDFPL